MAGLLSIKNDLTGLPWILLIICIVLLGGVAKSCSQAHQELQVFKEQTKNNVLAQKDRRQKEIHTVTTAFTKDIIFKEKKIQSLLDSLEVKQRQIKDLEILVAEKTTVEYVTQWDTLYEFIELNPTLPKKVTIVHDSCLTTILEFTPQGLREQAQRNIEVYDVTYFKRRPLFGWKWTPHWGKKEYYITTRTNCGLVIRKNQKLTFEN